MTRSWRTKLIHSEARVPEGFKSLAVPTYRGSTTLFESAAQVRDTWNHEEAPYPYGLFGTPTTLELAARIAELEKGRHTFLTPGGQAAIMLIYLALVRAGDHVLVPDSIYGPNREFAEELLRGLGIAVEAYDPLIGPEIDDEIHQIRPRIAATRASSGARARAPRPWRCRTCRRSRRRRTAMARWSRSTTPMRRASCSTRSRMASTSRCRR